MTMFDDVREWNRKFGLPYHGDGSPPHLLGEEELSHKTKHLVEELQEFRDACAAGDLEQAADALVDLVWVALGTAHFMGVPFDPCWAEVRRANMQKERARGPDDPRSKRASGLDVVKPEGWRPPDIAGCLAQGELFAMEPLP